MITTNTYKIFGQQFLDDIAKWIGENSDPEDIFSIRQLSDWAESNGYKKEE